LGEKKVIYRYEAHILGDDGFTFETTYPLRINDDVKTKEGAFKVRALALPITPAALPLVLLERVRKRR
jgi:hypothetical protein